MNKSSGKILALKPYSTLWWWYQGKSSSKGELRSDNLSYNSVKRGDYQLEKVLFPNDEDYGSTCPVVDYQPNETESLKDWLDSSIADVNENAASLLSDCVITSIPVGGETINLDSTNISQYHSCESDFGDQTSGNESSISESRNDFKLSLKRSSVIDKHSKTCRLSRKRKIQDQSFSDDSLAETMRAIDINESKSILVLKSGSSDCFSFTHGDLKLSSVCGKFELNGYSVKENETVIASCGFSSYHIVVNLKEWQKFSTSDHLNEVLIKNELSENVRNKVIEYLKSQDSPTSIEDCIIIALEKWRWPKLTALKLLMNPRIEFPNWYRPSFFENRSPVVQWRKELPSLLGQLKNAISSFSQSGLQSAPRVLICGGADAGKSSLFRYLANNLLSEYCRPVYVFDVDPGQTEFTPPGLISSVEISEPILSPPFINCLRFTGSKKISSSVCGVSVDNNPDLYIKNLLHLWQTFKNSIDISSSSPIFINTLGWMQGLGFLLLVDIIRIVRPTHLIEIKMLPLDTKANCPFDCTASNINLSKGWSSNVHAPLAEKKIQMTIGVDTNCVDYEYIKLTSARINGGRFKSNKKNRFNCQLAYLCRRDDVIFKRSLQELECNKLDIRNLYFHIVNEFLVDKHLVPEIIQNSWVHFCVLEEIIDVQSNGLAITSQEKRDPTSKEQTTEMGHSSRDIGEESQIAHVNASANFELKVLPFLNKNTCLGSGIVRNVNLEEGIIWVLSPENLDTLMKVNCIVRPQGISIPKEFFYGPC